MTPLLLRIKSVIASDVFRNTAMALSLLTTLASLLTVYSQSHEVQSLQYILKASDQAPDLEPLRPPRILSLGADLSFDTKSREASVFLNELSTEVEFVNKANVVAALESSSSVDAYIHTDLIREKLLGGFPEVKLESEAVDDFWKDRRQAAHGESISLRFNTTLRGLKGNDFIIHYLVLYRNPAGLIYDTYYWTAFRVDPQECSAPCSEDLPLFIVDNPDKKVKVCFFLRVEHTNVETHVYTDGETMRLNRLRDKFSAARRHGFETWHTLKGPLIPDEELKGD